MMLVWAAGDSENSRGGSARAPSMPILGLHHVTATADDAQDDLDFCVGALGLRLVKKTVNFDTHFVYHFYYGDEHGTPGTIWTTFPYKGHGVRVGSKGAGQVTVTSWSVPLVIQTWNRPSATSRLDCCSWAVSFPLIVGVGAGRIVRVLSSHRPYAWRR